MSEAKKRMPLDGTIIKNRNQSSSIEHLKIIPKEFTQKACKMEVIEVYDWRNNVWREIDFLKSSFIVWFPLSLLDGKLQRIDVLQEIGLPRWWTYENIIKRTIKLKKNNNKRNENFQNYRLKRGKSYEKDVFQRFQNMGFDITAHGLEKVHPGFHNFLKNSNDPTSHLLRYQPDQLIREKQLGNISFIEVKYSDSIEKTPYQKYTILYEKLDCRILICIKSKSSKKEYWVPIEKLKLKSGRLSVNEFPPDRRLPVDEHGWIAPREWNNKDSKHYNPKKYRTWQIHSKASGTPFRYFDFEEIKEYQYWAIYPHKIKEYLSNNRIFMNVLIDELEVSN
jgi:hypothetical protein